MANTNFYDKVIKYVVTAECTQPLRVGSVSGDTEEVLVHPTDGNPFIQASSISGVFRSYCDEVYGGKWTDSIFGKRIFEEEINSYEYAGRVRFTDGIFSDIKKVKLELRPRVSIDPELGVVLKNAQELGQKFNMAYIGAGAEFSFSIYLYNDQGQEKIESVFQAINAGVIQLGGQKSNGCGYFKITKLLRKVFYLSGKENNEDRKLWFEEDNLESNQYDEITSQMGVYSGKQDAYDIIVDACTENELLVKSIAVEDAGEDAPNSKNIRNGQKEYIIPGSSLKGAIRSQAEKVASYLAKQYGWKNDAENEVNTIDSVIENAFGSKKGVKQNVGNQAKRGNLYFFDTVVGNKEENDTRLLSHRIHIDKFTGGVINGGLFSEKNVAGKLKLHIVIRNWKANNAEQSCGLLLLTLRDLAIGAFTVGSGYSVGKGVIQVEKVTVTENGDQENCTVIDFSNNCIQDEKQIISRCFKALQEV